MKPLSGITVIDLTRVLAGPYCTMILSNLGARVIKVERPKTGDDSRYFGPFCGEESAYFTSINTGKESITINLKTPEGKQILEKLLQKSDIIVENYKPGVMEKLSLGFDYLHEKFPHLIYAAASGYGHSGPLSQRPAYDMIVQAAGGIMSITGYEKEGAEPVRVGSSIGDINAAMFCAIGVLTAIYHRTITGLGQKIDVSMLDSQVAILENAIARYELSGTNPTPLGTTHPSIAPFQAFKTSDSWIIIAAGNNKLWEKLCNCIEKPELLKMSEFLTNDSRTENRKKLAEILASVFITKTSNEWYDTLDSVEVPVSKINSIEQVINHPQVKARNMIIETSFNNGEIFHIAGNPVKMSSFKDDISAEKAPELGADNSNILSNMLGYTDEEINDFQTNEII
ncbi:CoA transferase [bacterium]|nr:CoA transferase [bacterium]